MGTDEVRTLLRAYAALALAHRAAELYAAAAPPDPYLSSIINSQELAARELDVILENALSELGGSVAPRGEEEEYAALVM